MEYVVENGPNALIAIEIMPCNQLPTARKGGAGVSVGPGDTSAQRLGKFHRELQPALGSAALIPPLRHPSGLDNLYLETLIST